jgi:nitroimidazol reductase NimA-like FMN-containing flavoprotein (pyridoxamine 5'-phosphate oxidase superfamily)
MSGPPQVRRTDKVMAQDKALDTLERGFCGRLATVGEDGYPYCLPLLYVWMDGQVWVHNTLARGHLRTNVDHDSRVCIVEDVETKHRFCEALMAKYAKQDWDRPKGFFPRLDQITVYAVTVERMTGKETPLPEVSQQWPAVDRTKTPNAVPTKDGGP